MKRAIGSPVEFSCHQAARLTIHSRCCQLAFFQCFGRLALEDVRHAEDLLCLPCPTFLIHLAQRMLSELTPATNASKAKALQSYEKYYYFFFSWELLRKLGVKDYAQRRTDITSPLQRVTTVLYGWKQEPGIADVFTRDWDLLLWTKSSLERDELQPMERSAGVVLALVRIWGMTWRPTQEGRVQCTSRGGWFLKVSVEK